MDRCHRIGQQKPVLVLRLATSHSVEGRLLKRARSKLALERLVIKKGAFLHQEVRAAAGRVQLAWATSWLAVRCAAVIACRDLCS